MHRYRDTSTSLPHRINLLDLGLDVHLPLLENQRFSLDSLPDIKDVFDDSFKVRGRVVGLGDEDIIVHSRGSRGVEGSNRDEPRHQYGAS
jgi:hypothetical protein